LSERRNLSLGVRWDVESDIVQKIAAERGVSPLEVMFDFGPAPPKPDPPPLPPDAEEAIK